MAHHHACGAGAWVQAANPSGPSSLQRWHPEGLHLVSMHGLTASALLRGELESSLRTARYAGCGLPRAMQ